MEQQLMPYVAEMKIEGKRVLVLAPHPDDEVFGCGGAIMRHVEAGSFLQVVIVSDGENRAESTQQPAYSKLRRAESTKAAQILCYGAPTFWGLPDRGVEYGEFLVQRIEQAINTLKADLVYAPSIYEIQPERRALGMAALEAIRRRDAKVKLAMYEVGVPMPRPNLLLNISDLLERKQEAMACFTSQLAKQPSDQHITALNQYRTYTLSAFVKAAEAYFFVQSDENILDLYEPEYQQQREMGLPMMPSDVPLVSVLIRSMDRPTLKTALDSVALQTYPNIEVVVVNARAEAHSTPGQFCGRFPLRVVNAGRPLARGQAANFGMKNARGTYLIFLDDDDFFLPDHVSKLTHALLASKNKGLRAAYTGVRLVDADNKSVLVLDEPWEPARFRGANYIPIHAVLFERSLLDAGCRFNEALECLEDWEFWLQVAQHTAFKHVPGISAIYRVGLGLSGLSQEGDAIKHIVNRAAIFESWQARFTPLQWVQTLYWFEMARNQFSQLAQDRHDEIQRLTEHLANTNHALDETRMHLTNELSASQKKLERLTERHTEATDQIPHLSMAMQNNAMHAAQLQQTVEAVLNSTSWKITAPMRFVSRLLRGQHREAAESLHRRIQPLGKKIYFLLPQKWRAPVLGVAFRIGGKLFSGMGRYEIWRQSAQHANFDLPTPTADAPSSLIDISSVAELKTVPPGRIAIHAHIFYGDLAPEFAKNLAQMPFAYDLYVSTPNDEVRLTCEQAFKELPYLNKLMVAVAPNRGRDIAPMFCTFGKALRGYDFIAHVHSKKSLYNNGATTGWREYLLENLLGTTPQIRRIFSLLTAHNENNRAVIGFVYPQNFLQLPYQANTWLSNMALGRRMCKTLGIEHVPTGYFHYPAGSMFWARMDAVAPLFDANFSIEDFPQEAGQTDATFAHGLERMFVLAANRSGFKAAILRDTSMVRWSPWGFEQYLARSKSLVESMISATDVQLVAFDIFDTLLIRPFLNPESIKTVIAKQAGQELGSIYLAFRAKAEEAARMQAGRDVGLDAIFVEFAKQSGLGQEAVARLRKLEENAELNAVGPRSEVITLLKHAVASRKRVVLASDMYLPRKIIEAMLAQHQIVGWNKLYLSSEVGLRKDSGSMYRHILTEENVQPGQMLMVGDNEHSDVQIPGDMGIRTCHMLRPVELARAVPRLGGLLDRALIGDDLNEQLTLGLIAQRNFQSVSHPYFDPFSLVQPTPHDIGYSVLGPIVLSFVQWLAENAKAEGVERLYFLAREGKFLKRIYDLWAGNIPDAPPAEYLVLSRRAVTVPILSSIEDIYALAKPTYFQNEIGYFLQERFGLLLNEQEWAELARQGLWKKDQLFEVVDGYIEHLKPLLLALEARILAQSKKEYPGLMAYLASMGMNENLNVAVVDVGYAATIQSRLNRLLKRKINGYYMVTDKLAETVAQEHEVSCQGCFGHYVSRSAADAPALLTRSFSLEKLLSADDAQIVHYLINDAGEVVGQSRHLSIEELSTRAVREEVQQGALAFFQEALALRSQLIADFTVPPALARSLYEAFTQDPSAAENAILSKLVLDDFYCGRGLVS